MQPFPPWAGHPGRRVGEPSSVPAEASRYTCPPATPGQEKQTGFGELVLGRSKAASQGIPGGCGRGSEGGENPAKLPMLKAILPMTCSSPTGLPAALQTRAHSCLRTFASALLLAWHVFTPGLLSAPWRSSPAALDHGLHQIAIRGCIAPRSDYWLLCQFTSHLLLSVNEDRDF